jgi:type VI secretion system protein ImpL
VLIWDANLLQQAQAQALPLQDFLKQGLPLFPLALQPQVAQVASGSTRDQMVTTIGNAAHWQPRPTWRVPALLQSSLDSQVASFQAAAPLLGPLINSFGAMGFPADAAQLSAQVDRERRGILEQLGVLLALDNLYSTSDPTFSWWDGKAGLAYTAFGVADASGLGSYLDSQRQIVTNLATHYASAVLAASGALPALDGGVATRWKALLADLDAYKAKLAGNPLQTLETLISPTLQDVTLATCLSQVAPASSRLAADYFLGRRDELAGGVHNRCVALLRTDSRAAYLKLAALFNDTLAGRFPFSKGKPPRKELMAEPPAIAGFYAAYDASQALIAQTPRADEAFRGHYDEIQTFMAQMKAVRTLFAPYLDTPQQYPVPTLGFNVEFRVNRTPEQSANEIFLWRLTVGDVALDLGGATAVGRWSYPQPATLNLTWAQNSPNVPQSVDDTPWAAVQGRTALYNYATPWGLLALLRDNPTTSRDFQHPEDVDDRTQTLKFTITTRPDPPPPLTQTAPAVAFIRIILTTPDGKTQLVLPHFPDHAPALSN